jgi:hypothetical protein
MRKQRSALYQSSFAAEPGSLSRHVCIATFGLATILLVQILYLELDSSIYIDRKREL